MECTKAYFDKVARLVLEANPGTVNLTKSVLKSIKLKGTEQTISIVEAELLAELGGGFNKVYNNPSGRQGFDGEIVDVKLTEDGTLDLKIKNIADGKVYGYNNVDISTGRAGTGQRVQLLVGFDSKVMPLKESITPSGFVDVTRPLSEASAAANRYVSTMLIGQATAAGGVIAPYVEQWHNKAKENSKLYNETVNLITSGFGHPDLWDKIKATMFVTGDINKGVLSQAVTIADTSVRRTKELLSTELPKLDRKIVQTLKNKADREQLDVIFGTSGFGNLAYMPEILQGIYADKSLEELKKMVGANAAETSLAKDLANFMVKREVKNNVQNAGGNKRVAVLATLYALEMHDSRGKRAFDTMMWLKDKHFDLFQDLEKRAITVHTLNEVVNRGKTDSNYGVGAGAFYRGWDGHNTLDVFEPTQEYKIVSYDEVDTYVKDGGRWKVVREPKADGSFGIISRESTKSYMDGIGVNINRIQNGVGISADIVKRNSDGEVDQDWMDANNVVRDFDNGYERFRVVLRNDEFDKAGGIRNIAHRLMRTYTHNKELIETETVRKFIVDNMTYKGQEGMLESLNNVIKANRSSKDKTELKPFINTKVDWDIVKKEYPEVASKYIRVENISNYGNFDREIKYVRKDMKDMLVGHSQRLIASDDMPEFQKWEQLYKQVVQMMKIKMVVVNPAKLVSDMASNYGILMTMDVSIADAFRYSKEAVNFTSEISKIESELVQAQFDLGLAEVDGIGVNKAKEKVTMLNERLKAHPYYEALEAGFVQSMGTSMIMKEFDTISGLQNTIKDLVNKLLEDNQGNKTQIHTAIATFMDYGFGANDMLDYLSETSKLNGTSFGDELIAISDRLKNKKARIKWKEEQFGRKLTEAERQQALDDSDVVGYISEFIAAPNSEAVRYGSWAMQTGDAMARWSLYNHRINQALEGKGIKLDSGNTVDVRNVINKAISTGKLTEAEWNKIKEDAGLEALHTFVDYRLNLPSEVKFLSDYGVLMFPSFWMRIQRIIWNLLKYHPLNAGTGLLIADALGNSGASIMSANILNKAWNGSLVHPGGQTHNLLDPNTYFLF